MEYKRARELNRIQKVLEGANIKLASIVSDIDGKSSRRMVMCIADIKICRIILIL
ncbi:hypothetical protein [Desulfosporosinus sp. I2]|uniref:hypothetical protein n=1 Tax=Desulfosporosinus sp. I2 TaxID=1617025 RepID=UPI001A9A4464|nr:hypothetical protein [Desulfosporosinus sp. I2]